MEKNRKRERDGAEGEVSCSLMQESLILLSQETARILKDVILGEK